MFVENDDLTSIDFDSDWQCCCCQTTGKADDDAVVSGSIIVDNDRDWFSLELPHIVDIKDEKNTDSRMNRYNWWYRKQFDWISSKQQVYLTFESTKNDSNLTLSNIPLTIWLNEVQIFSGSFISLQQPIELTENLRHDQDSANNKHTNILLVSCTNMSLVFHARIIVRGKVSCAAGQIQLDDQRIDNNDKSDRKKNNLLQYTLSFDGSDGRIGVEFDQTEKLHAVQSHTLSSMPSLGSFELITDEQQANDSTKNSEPISVPRLAIVILIVGTRGDVQPFIALGQTLHAAGHRVRLATHEIFRSFVRDNDLEFYPLAGDPDDLMSFMVKNAGLIPSVSSIVAGEINKKRHSLSDILVSTWNACTANDDETSLPFTAEAIIANPPSFGYIHCAEKLQIPLHIMFTMPWSPTTAFPHPMCNIDSSNGSMEKINLYSYDLIETLTWSGMRTITNNFRKTILGLPTLRARQAIRVLIDERVPHTYCWSPSIVPKPDDWGTHINVSGFLFLNLATTYTDPPKDLLDFLGLDTCTDKECQLPTPPIYIGFGSITGHDSTRLLKIIIDALNKTGYRALLAGFNTDTSNLPKSILRIGDVPHDWLFQHVSAVCHHGGAGTTAAGLRAGKPTIIVPFFGDQYFWGSAVAKSGAGPCPLSIKNITADKLADAFKFVHQSTTRDAAERIRMALLKEDGCAAAVHAFHTSLPVSRMRSDLEPTFAACYRLDKYNIQISRPVARVLVAGGVIDESELFLHPTKDWQFMSDNYIHLPTKGIFEHTPKAFSSLFTDRAGDSPTTATGTVESVAKVFGLGLGRLSVGCLSLYGEVTDVLDHAPAVYDPYSEPDTNQRPHVEDFKSGAEAAGRSLWHGWKEGIVGVVKEPYIGYQRDGIWGGVGGALMGTVNVVMKPTAGTLSSITWLGRGTYASVKKAAVAKEADKMSVSTSTLGLVLPSSTTDDKQQQEYCNTDDAKISYAAQVASAASGFYPHICEQILLEFSKIKREQGQSTIFLPSSE